MKKIIGIVAEYNPFHEGHVYHIQETKRKIGEDAAVICVMSGDFVQRGEWAIQPKSLRAQNACRGGADLVIELPLPWCLASAAYFANGAVAILKALRITHLSFGSESGDLDRLMKISEHLSENSFQNEIRHFLKQNPNMSYPSARKAVFGASFPVQSNDLLALEYLQALKDSSVQPLAVKRTGKQHDERGEGSILSASEIRSRILSGTVCALHIDAEKIDLACVSRLRMLKREEFDLLPDCRDGLSQRIYDAVKEHSTVESICLAAKTKRYTLSRIRRAVWCAALGLHDRFTQKNPPYARVLAVNQRGRGILSSVKKNCPIPVLTQPKEVLKHEQNVQEIFQLGSDAHDLFMLCYPGRANDRCGEDYRNGPVIAE